MEKSARKYTKSHPRIHEALAAVRDGTMSATNAAKHFAIPRTTLSDRVNGVHTRKVGRPGTFTDVEENEICDILLRCANVGAPLNKRKLIAIVRAIALARGVDEAKFGNRWHRRLLLRHKDVSLRTQNACSFKKSREWTMQRCEEWIKILQDLADRGFLSNPEGLWNLDESGFKLAELYDRVYAQRGSEELVGFVKGSETDRDNMTLLALGNASGKILRPLILYSGKMHIESHFDGTNDRCYLSTNASGVMDTFVLTSYLEQEWLPSLTCQKNVLFFDGHSSHVNCLAFLATCINHEKEIEVVCLPSGQTSCLQPLDKTVFGCVKQKWTQYLQDSRLDVSIDVTRHNFPAHVVNLWTPNACRYSFNLGGPLKDGFEKTGLYPFSPQLLRGTVDPNRPADEGNEQEKDVVEADKHYDDISRILREKLGLGEEKALSCLIQIKQVICRTTPAQVIAVEFHKHLLKAAPKKRRQVKDSRLDAKHGLVCTAPRYVELKADAIKKAKENRKKASKKSLTLVDGAVASPVLLHKQAARARKSSAKSRTTKDIPEDQNTPATSKVKLPARARTSSAKKSVVKDIPTNVAEPVVDLGKPSVRPRLSRAKKDTAKDALSSSSKAPPKRRKNPAKKN